MIIPDDCTVRLVDLPVECGGMVSLSPDGHFNIYLNARLDCATQRVKFLHELRHILNDDFFNDDDIRTVESRADAAESIPSSPVPLSSIPTLIRARNLPSPPLQKLPHRNVLKDLLSCEEVPAKRGMGLPRPPVHISPRQTAILARALSDLDAFVFQDLML